MPNRNRDKGHRYERQLAQEFRDLGFTSTITSRYGSRLRDDECVDLLYTQPFSIQAKCYATAPSYIKWLKEMPKDGNYNVVIHKKPNVGEVVVMSKEDFYEIVKMLVKEKIIKPV